MKGAELIVECFKKIGIKNIFGIPGGAVLPLYDVFHDTPQIRHILVRHEQCAAHASEGYARASGKIGVCIATSGPGATNLTTGITSAYMDSAPIMAFGGQVPTGLIGGDAFQEADLMGITMPITKHNFQVRDAKEIGKIIVMAYKIATTGRPGPVYIDLPKDAQLSEAGDSVPNNVEMPGYHPKTEGHPLQIKRAAELLVKAERPVIIAGGGVISSGASTKLMEIAQLLGAPVVTTLLGKGAIPEDHPLCLGPLGMHGRKSSNYAIINADLILAVGCRFSDRITGDLSYFAKDCKVVHIDIDPAEIGKNVKVDVPVVGDAKKVLKALINTIPKIKRKNAWTERMKEIKAMCECSLDHDTKPVDPRSIIKELNKILKAEDIVTTGVGRHQMFVFHFLKRYRPRTFISSGGLGTMGFGFPAAIGAKVSNPEVNVFDLDGDGSFQMTCKELATCKVNGIKVIPIIFHDCWLGMVQQWQALFCNKRFSSTDLGNIPDFVKLAGAYGLEGENVDRTSELRPAILEALKSEETFVIDVRTNPEAHILPMIPPGGRLDQFFGGCLGDKKLSEAF
jgi:acetolactate synthase-1/2/3 large subunit